MSGRLATIAARYAAGLRAAALVGVVSDARREHILRCVMQYGVVWNCVHCEAQAYDHLPEKEFAAKFEARASHWHEHFGRGPSRHDFEGVVVPYIRYQMRWMFPDLKTVHEGVWPKVLDPAELPRVAEWFLALPDRELYGYDDRRAS